MSLNAESGDAGYFSRMTPRGRSPVFISFGRLHRQRASPSYGGAAGEITTTALLDRELKAEYILIVRAVDGGVGPQQKTGIATVTPLTPLSGASHQLLVTLPAIAFIKNVNFIFQSSCKNT